MRQSRWQEYLDWAFNNYKISVNSVCDETQIHTHMCYSEFNDIIEAIADMDADVITIEISCSDMELLDIFNEFNYPNEIGPGVYDIHSPKYPNGRTNCIANEKSVKTYPRRTTLAKLGLRAKNP